MNFTHFHSTYSETATLICTHEIVSRYHAYKTLTDVTDNNNNNKKSTQDFTENGEHSFIDVPLPLPPLSFRTLPSISVSYPLPSPNPIRGLEERCKLPKRVLAIKKQLEATIINIHIHKTHRPTYTQIIFFCSGKTATFNRKSEPPDSPAYATVYNSKRSV